MKNRKYPEHWSNIEHLHIVEQSQITSMKVYTQPGCFKLVISSVFLRTVGLFIISLFLISTDLLGQVNPPRPIDLTASSVQSLNFGVFSITGSNGGTVTVSNTGVRSSAGDIFLSGNDQSYGIFTIETITGTVLYMMNGPSATLTGSNGGQMTMTLGETYPELPYVASSSTTVFQIGATLDVGPLQNNPPGDYYGTYEIIINHQ